MGQHKKQALIDINSAKLKEKGFKAENCEGNTDTEIVQAVIGTSKYGSTTLIGENTDLLVILLYFMNPDNKSMFFHSDKKARNLIQVYNINNLKLLLGEPSCSHMLFLRSDTTSRIFGIGRNHFLRGLSKVTEI